MKTIASTLEQHARERGDALWLIDPDSDTEISWAALLHACREVAAHIARTGVRAGESVAIACPNGLAAALAFLGATYGGFRATPLNLVAGSRAMRYMLEHSRARLLLMAESLNNSLENSLPSLRETLDTLDLPPQVVLMHEEKRVEDIFAWDKRGGKKGETAPPLNPPLPPPLNPPAHDDEALLLYTSGTTGKPKGVLLSHRNLLAAGSNVALAHALTPQDRGLCVLPIYHINGLCVSVMGTLVSGGAIVMPRRFSVRAFWGWVEKYSCTWFSAVPTLFAYILNERAGGRGEAQGLRFARSASSPLPPETLRAFEDRFGIPLIESLGLTETGSQITANPLPPSERKAGSAGVAWGNEVMIAKRGGKQGDQQEAEKAAHGEEGEIWVRGENVTRGYLRQDEETRQAFSKDSSGEEWFRTGDLGRMDDEGYVFVTGRIKELIIKGGENIAPREIDEALLSHDDVLEAAAFAQNSAQYGQTVRACVRLKEGRREDEEALLEHCRALLGLFKSPDRVFFLDDLPKGPSGKVQRLKLQESVGEAKPRA